ncbi:hypothetical protein GCM10020255_027920 [Rhodococcus baikonurensis]
MNLASDPWLPTLTRDGMRTVGLVDALTADVGVLDISSGDPLEDAAIMRLLVACDIAAADAGISSAQWVDAHRDRFDLFDPVTPFWQHPGWQPSLMIRKHHGPLLQARTASSVTAPLPPVTPTTKPGSCSPRRSSSNAARTSYVFRRRHPVVRRVGVR